MRILISSFLAFFCACSLAGLDEGLEQQTCSQDEGCDCMELNAIMPSGDPCMTWRRGSDFLCELAPRDLDNDFAPAAECAPEGVAPDCDDAAANVFPGADEVCDGIDNNCDDVIDNAPFQVGTATTLLSTAEAESVDYALDSTDGSLLLGYINAAGATGTPAVARITGPHSSATPTLVQTFEGEAGPLMKAVASQALAVPIAGSEPEPVALHIESSVYAGFLDGENVRVRQEQVDAPLGTTGGYPITAAAGKNVFAAWIERQDRIASDEACVISTGTQSAAVRLSSIRSRSMLPDRALRLEFPADEALTLGTTTDPHRVGLVVVEGFGAVIAIADGQNIRVQALGALSDTEATLPALVGTELVINTGKAQLGEVFLSVGETSGTAIVLGLAYRAGCAAAARAEFRILNLDTRLGTFTASEAFPALDNAEQRRPQLMFDRGTGSWVAAWHAGRAVIQTARYRDGVLDPATTTRLFATECDDSDRCVTERFYLWQLPEEIGVVSFLRSASMPGFYSASLTCSAPE